MKDSNGNDIRCWAAGKVCYTVREAGIVMNQAKKHHLHRFARGKGKEIPKRKYFCTDCGFYHLTHYTFYCDSRLEHHCERKFYALSGTTA